MNKMDEKVKMRILGWMGRQSYKNMWFGYQREVDSKKEALNLVKKLKKQYPKAVKEFEYREYGDRFFFELLKREDL